MKRKYYIGAAAAIFLATTMITPALAVDGAGTPSEPVTQSLLIQKSTINGFAGQYEAISSFQVKADQYYDDMGYSSNQYDYTEDELMKLAKVIHLEVRGESYVAMLAVGNVVMNRVLSPGYPGDTIEDVITRPNQFCYNPSVKPSAVCIRAARDVLEHEVWVIPQNIYYFKVSRQRANWGAHKYYTHIGVTAFYSDNYSGRSSARSIPEALNKRIYEWPQYGCVPGLRVILVQKMLNRLGFTVNTNGYFETNTQIVLKKFQQSAGLAQTGIADPSTLSRMLSKCKSTHVLGLVNKIS